jgi:hypothetical protein
MPQRAQAMDGPTATVNYLEGQYALLGMLLVSK